MACKDRLVAFTPIVSVKKDKKTHFLAGFGEVAELA
jgi:hypothetical protein